MKLSSTRAIFFFLQKGGNSQNRVDIHYQCDGDAHNAKPRKLKWCLFRQEQCWLKRSWSMKGIFKGTKWMTLSLHTPVRGLKISGAMMLAKELTAEMHPWAFPWHVINVQMNSEDWNCSEVKNQFAMTYLFSGPKLFWCNTT